MEEEKNPPLDLTLENLKTYTGWNRIFKAASSYVISFDENDAHQIKGLEHDDSTFFLDGDEFKNTPVSFHIIRHKRHFQYWTMNKRLHRSDDLPAYVMYDSIGKRLHRRWFWNGMQHRLNGPADEMVTGYEIDDSSMSTHVRESWDKMQYQWFIEGEQGDAIDSIPVEAVLLDGWRYRNKITGRVDSINDDSPAFFTGNVTIFWYKTYNDENDKTASLRPAFLEAHDLGESYSQGTFKKRYCNYLLITWLKNNKVLPATIEIEKFNRVIKNDLLTDLNLWDGGFFADDETSFLVISEYDRIVQ